jgi:hypothetical protein
MSTPVQPIVVLRRASRVMGHDTVHSTIWFVDRSMEWLAAKLGDLHVEFHADNGWSVACCYEEQSWEGWQHDDRLSVALAKAVLTFEETT